MRLTLHTDYAIRMLIFLAGNGGGRATVADVAEAYGYSRNHLMKVAMNLWRLGYVRTLRGRSGGIALARSAEQINLGEVVRVVTLWAVGRMSKSPESSLDEVVAAAFDAFLHVFDKRRLADVAGECRTIGSAPRPAQEEGESIKMASARHMERT